MRLVDLVRPLERAAVLDPAAEWLSAKVAAIAGGEPQKSALSGTWLGHALHPVLTDVPIGFFLAATLLDVAGGEGASGAADAMTAAGLLAVVPTAATGLSDWSDTVDAERRVGFVHGLANVGAAALYTAALVSRRAGARGTARLFSVAGLAVMSASGYLGGHLVFGRGIGVDHTVFGEPPTEWTLVAREVDLPEGGLHLAVADGYAVLLHRQGSEVLAIADRCNHAGGPLHEGELDAEGCVTCPWHGSRFRLTDGRVLRGPATVDQPAFEARITDGSIEVRLAQH